MVKDLIGVWAWAVMAWTQVCWAQLGDVKDCQPCLLPAAAGAKRELRFEWAREGRLRKVVALQVGAQRLVVPEAEEVGLEESVYVGTPDINFDGKPDLQLIVERGMPNARAMYWVFVPDRGEFAAVGVYPVFTVNARQRRLEAYVKKGPAGKNSTRTLYVWRQGKLVVQRR